MNLEEFRNTYRMMTPTQLAAEYGEDALVNMDEDHDYIIHGYEVDGDLVWIDEVYVHESEQHDFEFLFDMCYERFDTLAEAEETLFKRIKAEIGHRYAA